MDSHRSRACSAALALALFGLAVPAHSATWVGRRTTPTLREIVAIDSTGEANWPFGAEDVAGDGLGTFRQPEQSIDIRTAYAATDQQRFWARVYVSDTQAAGANVRAFVFIDSDRNNATGGTAVATEIDPSFTSDPRLAGYDYVVEVAADGVQLWEWRGNQYVNGQLPPPRASAERGLDTDPIRLGASSHGYIQASIDLGPVNLTQACDANLYFRTVNDTATLGAGDLDVGQVGACVPSLNRGGVPVVLVPPNGCQSNDECPAGGVCRDGRCALAAACTTEADCNAGMQCTPDGRCVPAPTGSCATNADCDGLICQGRQCVACTLGGDQCGAGEACSADGHCTVGGVPAGAGSEGPLVLGPDEKVKGGAFHCTLSGNPERNGTTALGAAVLALLATRRRSARRR